MDDLISRQAAIDEIMGQPSEVHYPSWYAEQIRQMPAVPPKVVAEIKIDDDALQRMVNEAVEQIMAEQSDPDVIRIVRCKNCAWWQREWPDAGNGRHYCTMADDHTDADFYCANAERREE